MKKRILVFCLCLFIITSITTFAAEKKPMGAAIATDIGTMIDFVPIVSYNINQNTYVIIDDLRNYGFDVEYSEYYNYYRITRSPRNTVYMPSVGEVNIKKKDIKIGKKLCDVYKSDIIIYLDDKIIEGVKANGRTMIKIDYLKKYGYLTWDKNKRSMLLDTIKYDLDVAYNKATKQEITITKTEEETITYKGEVENGKPNGIGIMTIKNTGIDSLKDLVYLGYFKDGVPKGKAIKTGSELSDPGKRRTFKKNVNYALDANGFEIGIWIKMMKLSQLGTDSYNRQDGEFIELISPDYPYYKYGIGRMGITRDYSTSDDYLYGYYVSYGGTLTDRGFPNVPKELQDYVRPDK